MEPEESLPEMGDVVEVLEDPNIALARKINSATWQSLCGKESQFFCMDCRTDILLSSGM